MKGVGTGLFYGGAIALPVGGLLTWMGLARQSADRHAVDEPDRAMRDADRYNAGGASRGGNRPMQSQSAASRSTQ